MSLFGGLCRAVGRAVRRVAAAVVGAVKAVADAVKQVVGAAAAVAAEALARHRDRWACDDEYRALLLAAVGAVLSTLLPPALAAAVTTGIGVTGLLDAPVGDRSAGFRRAGRYGSPNRYDPSSEDRSAGPLWERGFGYDDD